LVKRYPARIPNPNTIEKPYLALLSAITPVAEWAIPKLMKQTTTIAVPNKTLIRLDIFSLNKRRIKSLISLLTLMPSFYEVSLT
jgi:hypothetical protein